MLDVWCLCVVYDCVFNLVFVWFIGLLLCDLLWVMFGFVVCLCVAFRVCFVGVTCWGMGLDV